ncbi:hypothetical protein PsorP6_005717 [Peronosclerospora sorghi]|uniref:Uncharacterized protein n=1 Tax=Peronosclerospora sorghi TaxID=230839 RepID=A0ACC0W5T2_9STRA|nr:hypothetical protein PsorP6_005717 [Peronosclerospora sorghi]
MACGSELLKPEFDAIMKEAVKKKAIEAWLKDCHINVDNAKGKVSLLQRHPVAAHFDKEKLLFMAIGSEYFEHLMASLPRTIDFTAISPQRVIEIVTTEPRFGANLAYIDQCGVNKGKVRGKMEWLLKVELTKFEVDPEVFFCMACGSELLETKAGTTGKARFRRMPASDVAAPHASVHPNRLED